MNRSREEILKAKKATEVFHWIKAHPDQADSEVCTYFSDLAKQEAIERIIAKYGSYEPGEFYEELLNKRKP
ncbi:MAG: hypothetical protein NC311_08965 [Muribaculaceae bacterium]|nr:hypothetical protein [Muribaculaceae bacterium]